MCRGDVDYRLLGKGTDELSDGGVAAWLPADLGPAFLWFGDRVRQVLGGGTGLDGRTHELRDSRADTALSVVGWPGDVALGSAARIRLIGGR